MRRVQTLSVLALTGALLSACGNTGSVAGDTTKPAVSLSATPTALSGAGTVSLVATASDNVGVKSVTFYRGDTKLAEDTTSPYEYSDTVSAASGTLTYRAVATDTSGNTSDAATATVTVGGSGDTTPPTGSFTVVKNTGSNYTVNVTASDAGGVARAEFYDNGQLSSTDTEAPYSTSLNYSAAQNGAHSITVKLYDLAGNVTTLAAQTITVYVDTVAPKASLTVSPTELTATGTATFTAAASDDVGVTKVEFYDGATLVATDTEAPYTASKTYAFADNGTHTITAKAYDLAGNVGQSSATVKVAIADANEPNDSVAQATALTLNTPVNGAVAGKSRDMDYFKYTAAAGEMLKLTVKSVSVDAGSTLDPYVMVLMPDGKTVLEKDDDGGAGLESEIRFNAPVAGTYTVVVTSFLIHDDPNATDDKATNTYQIALTRR
ncbi:Ig-like domain-containing protein [uncultured Deinococcus sp.]|uniref:Ig-like domain-containing protein n=1 Tax=uncultured Deinococcus sp. TaxID=158789 RepID=UPI0025838D60|nr:Ig-like domain-containing protein [uncultured Deinococcus sp.]